MLQWEAPHCNPFRNLLAHPKLVKYMNTFFGRGWKLDHAPFMITGDMKTKEGKDRPNSGNFHDGGGGTMHGSTARQFNGSQYYTCAPFPPSTTPRRTAACITLNQGKSELWFALIQ